MGEIILYSSSECSRCFWIKKMLDIHNVQYQEVKDNKRLMIDKEIEEYPALEVDGKILTYGPLITWLQEKGWYSLWEDNEDESNKA